MEIKYLIWILIVLVFVSSTYAIEECNWELKYLGKDIFEIDEEVEWEIKVQKDYGNKSNITLKGLVEDLLSDWSKEYERNLKNVKNYNTPDFNPNLWPNKAYLLFYNITNLSCNDTNSEDNILSKIIFVKGEQEKESNNCDWKLNLFSDYTFEKKDDVNWKLKIEKINGEKANITVRGYVKDYYSDWQMDYKPLTDEQVTNYRNKEYSPNLYEGKIYEIFYNITELNCNDTNSGDNYISKLIYVGEDLPKECEECIKCKKCKPCKTITQECPLIVQSSNENDIKNEVKENISFISKEVKERRYAIYFFCLLLICMLIHYITSKND